MTFDDLKYTEDALITQLGLIELHVNDGSAVEAGCKCIQTKHLHLIEGLSSEGQSFTENGQKQTFHSIHDWALKSRSALEKTPDDKELFKRISEEARELRKRIEYEDYPKHTLTHKECMKDAIIQCCGHPTHDFAHCSCDPSLVCQSK